MNGRKQDNVMESILFTILLCLFASTAVFAELKTFEKEYIYQASEADSKLTSRAIALEQVKRLLLEELGVYLEARTEVKNFQLTKDQITTITAGIARVEVTNESWDGKTYCLKAKLVADPDEVAKSIDALRKDLQLVRELEDSKEKAENLMRELEEVKKGLKNAKTQGDAKESKLNADLVGKYNKDARELSALDWFERGFVLNRSGRHRDAIDAYTRSIELNPSYSPAFVGRGMAHDNSRNKEQAKSDCNRAIELDPKLSPTYTGRLNEKDLLDRGRVLAGLGDLKGALVAYTKIIVLNDKNDIAYNNRGGVYCELGKRESAINDWRIAARLGNKTTQDFLRKQGVEW